jgi:hypothetical protein
VYNAPNSSKFLFLLSTRAGGLGINLQTADTVVLYDSDWNPQMDLQAMDRAHRIGQRKQVTVFRFVVEHSIEQKMVERATKKLFLDALVVRQGKLNDAEKSVTAQELQDMVRFGANRIFSGAGTEVTDEDIDAILTRGTELTKAENEKLQANAQNDLLNFSLSDQDQGSFQTFEGKDYKGHRGAHGFEFIEPAKRERKSNYDINQYYRDALRVNEKKGQQKKEFKPIQRSDWQFFDTERLDVLERKDFESRQKLSALRNARRAKEREERRIKEEKEKEERKKARYAAMRARRIAEAAAAGLAAPAEGDEKDMSDEGSDEEEEEDKANRSAGPTPAPSATPAPSEGPAAMEVDGQAPAAPAVKKEEAGATAATEGAVKSEPSVSIKVEDAAPSSAAPSPVPDRRKSSRGKSGKLTPAEASASPAPSPAPTSVAATDADAMDEEHDEAGDEDEDAELMEEAGCLTPEERAELDRLHSEGFATWQRKHVQSFIKACEKFGRDDLANIRVSVEDKDPEEVEKYHHTFFAKWQTMKEGERFVKQIERGEQRLQKTKTLQAIIDRKVKRHKANLDKMTIPYPTNQQKSKTGNTRRCEKKKGRRVRRLTVIRCFVSLSLSFYRRGGQIPYFNPAPHRLRQLGGFEEPHPQSLAVPL